MTSLDEFYKTMPQAADEANINDMRTLGDTYDLDLVRDVLGTIASGGLVVLSTDEAITEELA